MSNVEQREAPNISYNKELIFKLIKIGLSNEHWLSYADVIWQHRISPVAATAEGARTTLIQHLYGEECICVVAGEEWGQCVGIKIIDLMCEWIDNGMLSSADLVSIGCALGLRPSKTHQKRSLLSKA